MTGFDDLLTGRVMAILRGFPPAETVRIAQRAWDLGITAVEVPIGRPDQVAALRAAIDAGRERRMRVGAGTVITEEQVHVAARAGAAYTVAPGLDAAVMAASEAAGLPHLPGVATPSEAQRVVRAGATWIKGFPASSLGPSWFRELRGPFPDLCCVATGGVTAETAGSYLAAGVRLVALGSALNDPSQLDRVAQLVKQ